MEDVIAHEEQGGRGSFFIERDGVRIGVLTYRRSDGSHVTIDHTQVDVSLRGQGIARRLFDAAVAWARQTNTRITPRCSYAAARFARDPSISDVLG